MARYSDSYQFQLALALSQIADLELELIQTQMTQKPMLRAEVYACALRASQHRGTLRAWRSVPLWTATITSMATRACAPD
jgi:hypothetical protein